jgi:hypothetical protein
MDLPEMINIKGLNEEQSGGSARNRKAIDLEIKIKISKQFKKMAIT